MHEAAGVVEILVQILQNTPILNLVQNTPPPNENCLRVQIREFQNTPPMKIVRESKSKSFRITPPPNENCQRVQIWEFQNTPILNLEQNTHPPNMKIVRESKSESFRIPLFWTWYRIPPPMKIVRESKSESFRIPPQWNCQRVQIRVSEYPPQMKLSESPNLRVSEYPPPIENLSFLSQVQISCSPEYPPPRRFQTSE